MQTLTSTDAKHGFGWLVDLAWAYPLAGANRRRPVVGVVAIKEFERLNAPDRSTPKPESDRVRRSTLGSG